MLGSWLLTLTVSAALLLVPALVGLLGVRRHNHVAETAGATRRARVAVAGTLVGLAALGSAALFGAGAGPASLVAVVVTAALLLCAGRWHSWAVRGVVVGALLVVAVVGFLGWLLNRTLVSPAPAPSLLTAGIAWLVLLFGLTRAQLPVRDSLAALAVRDADEVPHGPGRRGPALSLAALVAAGAVAVAVTGSGGPGEAPDAPPSQAGHSGEPDPTASATSGPGAASGSAGTRPYPGPNGGTRAGRRSPGAGEGSTTGTPEDGTDAPVVTTAAPSPTGSATPDPLDPTKTPGYIKNGDKRPTDVPSPGGPHLP